MRIEAGTLAAIGGRLYGTIQVDVRKEFVRLEPRTGAIAARSAPIRQELFGPAVAAGGLVWFQGAGSADLVGLDPVTLDQRARVALADLRGVGGGPATLAPGPDADTLLVAGQGRVDFVDAVRSREERHLDVPGQVTGVSLSPDGTRLYVASRPRRGTSGTVRVLDPNSGAVLESTEGNPALGPQATAGGVWLTESGGMAAGIGFMPIEKRAHTPSLRGAGASGGGFDVLPTISGGVAWLGGYGSVGCADPVSGRLRAHTTKPARRPAFLSAITRGGRPRLRAVRPRRPKPVDLTATAGGLRSQVTRAVRVAPSGASTFRSGERVAARLALVDDRDRDAAARRRGARSADRTAL